MANKYIYELYKASDGKFNVEQKVIIYQNSEFIYFKKSGDDKELDYTKVDRVYNSIVDIPSGFFEDRFAGRKYLYKYDKSTDKEILEKRASNFWIKDIKRSIYLKEQEVHKFELDLDTKKRELQILRDKLAELQSSNSEV